MSPYPQYHNITTVSLENLGIKTSEKSQNNTPGEIISPLNSAGDTIGSYVDITQQVSAILDSTGASSAMPEDRISMPQRERKIFRESSIKSIAESAIFDECLQILQKINLQGIDFLERDIRGRNIAQVELNVLVSEYSGSQSLDPSKLDTFFREVFRIAGYNGEVSEMYRDAIGFVNELKIQSLLQDMRNISATAIFEYIDVHGVVGSAFLLRAFISNSSRENLNAFFKGLEHNDPLRNNLLTSDMQGDLIHKLGENGNTQYRLIAIIIGDEAILKTLSPDMLMSLDTILQKHIQDGTILGGLADTLNTTLGLARNRNNPENKIAYYLQNGDEQIAELLSTANTPENRAWKQQFDDLRRSENGAIERLNMIKRGEKIFFDSQDLDTFFNISFPDLEKGIQKKFIKEYVIPKEGKYHPLLEQFPRFRETIEHE